MQINYFPQISQTGFWEHGDQLCHTCSISLSKWIIDFLKDQKEAALYDFGCGHGQYLKQLQNAGFTKLTGFEGSIPSHKEVENIKQQDLTVPFDVQEKGNCVFLEVAEHIPAQYEDILLTNVANACNNKLISSWAIPLQGGHGHVNEISNIEAIDKISKRGFKFLSEETIAARNAIREDDCPWFKNTVLVFQKV